MAWRVAKALETMRDQFNALYPDRDKSIDGTIGDTAHQGRESDHNAWIQDAGVGVVSAFDLTHDPGNGVDTWAIAEHLRQKHDPRIRYVISNKRIFSSTTSPWTWRKYTGSNPHSSHMHVSVRSEKRFYDDTAAWDLFVADARPTLRRGARGVYVRELQVLLSLTPDGIFGVQTETAVKQLQADNGLSVDGIVGPATWAVLDEIVPPEPSPEPEPAPPPEPARRMLRKGDTGDDVRIVQGILCIAADGVFGAETEAAVKAFQRGVGLSPDGVIGPLTWAALDRFEQLPVDADLQQDIVCTVFGGKADPNKSAYEDRWITDDELGLALPFRFSGPRPQIEVINRANGRKVVCEIVDVGPWNTNDPYWETSGRRPQAESGTDMRGRKTNLAGIDLTPAAARAIGLSGKGRVDWAFAVAREMEEAEGQPATD